MFESIKNKFKLVSANNKETEEKEKKKTTESLIFLIILLIVTVLIINNIWDGDKEKAKVQNDKVLADVLGTETSKNSKEAGYYSLQENL